MSELAAKPKILAKLLSSIFNGRSGESPVVEVKSDTKKSNDMVMLESQLKDDISYFKSSYPEIVENFRTSNTGLLSGKAVDDAEAIKQSLNAYLSGLKIAVLEKTRLGDFEAADKLLDDAETFFKSQEGGYGWVGALKMNDIKQSLNQLREGLSDAMTVAREASHPTGDGQLTNWRGQRAIKSQAAFADMEARLKGILDRFGENHRRVLSAIADRKQSGDQWEPYAEAMKDPQFASNVRFVQATVGQYINSATEAVECNALAEWHPQADIAADAFDRMARKSVYSPWLDVVSGVNFKQETEKLTQLAGDIAYQQSLQNLAVSNTAFGGGAKLAVEQENIENSFLSMS